MKIPVVAILALIVSLSGCGGGEPKAVKLEDVPKKLDDSFAKASPEVKAVSARITASVSKDSTSAYLDLKALSERQDLTAEQRDAVNESLGAVNQKLVDDAAGGDLRAKQMIELRKAHK